jgi:hypothetical protein
LITRQQEGHHEADRPGDDGEGEGVSDGDQEDVILQEEQLVVAPANPPRWLEDVEVGEGKAHAVSTGATTNTRNRKKNGNKKTY